MAERHCPSCGKSANVHPISKEEVYKVKGDSVTVTSSVLICPKCSEEMFDENIDHNNLLLAYNAYRKSHGLLFPQQLREIRGKYGLSQRSLGRLLQWGEITLNRYESGAIQDAAHNEVLEFIQHPENMKALFEKNRSLLPPHVAEKLDLRLKGLLNNKTKEGILIDISEYLQRNNSIDEYSGYKKFNLCKFEQMVVFLATSLNGVFKTAVNKYLWYMDVLHFKEYTVSISGSTYLHWRYGPVPDEYDIILSLMVGRTLRKEEVVFAEDVVGEKFFALAEPDLSCFTEEERNVMQFVVDQFRHFTATQLKRQSHQEKAYQETSENDPISYNYASELSLTLSG